MMLFDRLCRRVKTSYLQVKSNFIHWSSMVDILALNAQSESSSCMSGGKVFQSLTVLGKKDIFLLSALQPMVWNLFLVFFFGEICLLSFLMATSLLSTLYRIE